MKKALIFISGVAVGMAATFFGCKRYFEKQADERIEQEVADVKEAYAKKAACREKVEKNEEAKKQIVERDHNGSVVRKIENDISKENSNNSLLTVEQAKQYIDPDHIEPLEEIANLRKKYGGSSDLEERILIHRNVFEFKEQEPDDEDEIDPGSPSEGINTNPYSISPNQFANENRYFDKITIYIYNDDVAIEEGEQPIDNLEALVGKDWIDCFGINGSEENVALIRNENRGTDFELIRMDEDYIPDTMPVEDR